MNATVVPYTNHLVICGWKQEMHLLIIEMLHANPQWSPKDIVIVSGASDELVKTLKGVPEVEGVHLIRDEYFSEAALIRASITTASKALILADRSDRSESSTETDAKTVMAAMAIKKLAPLLYVTTELLDLDFLQYVKMAKVDEVIYSREYWRILLANATSASGITHVIAELLDSNSTCMLTSVQIPQNFIGRKFSDLAEFFAHQKRLRMICIGLLENTENVNVLKRKALVAAQKTTEVRNVLNSLTLIREMECNVPKLNPGDGYIIQKDSMAVVLTNQDSEGGPQTISDDDASGKDVYSYE